MKPARSKVYAFLALASVAVLLLGQACESSSSNDSSTPPAISPTSVKIAVAQTNAVVFTATDGTPNYTWQVSNPGLGSLVSANDTAIYTSYPVVGQNFITVTDANSNSVTATVTQM